MESNQSQGKLAPAEHSNCPFITRLVSCLSRTNPYNECSRHQQPYMLFNSLQFLLFFPVVTLLYFAAPQRLRWLLLLTASCVFYTAFIPAYIFILAVTITIDYLAALYIEKSTGRNRKIWLTASIVSTAGVLFIFKYFNFFNANVLWLSHLFHWNYPVNAVKIILPIGLSFHTFQSLSYVVEVYRGRQKAEHHFGIYSLYVMFYPQLVAGPIERPQNLLHQFYEKHEFEYERVVVGLRRMLWGLFKKVVVADNAAVLVNMMYTDPHGYNGVYLIIATVAFAFQIYCDFSGYSDIAIGAAQVMGFRLMENFNYPYLAASMTDFWRRWHISLSTWFRDYVYIPLGGSKTALSGWIFNILVTFLLSGLWHGANWTYVLWGLLNGIYLIVGRLTRDLRSRAAASIGLDNYPALQNYLSIMATFALVCFSWVLFRANNVGDALYVYSRIFSIFTIDRVDLAPIGPLLSLVTRLIVFLLGIEFLLRHPGTWISRLTRQSTPLRWGVYYAAIALVVYFLNGTTPSQFIYFQF